MIEIPFKPAIGAPGAQGWQCPQCQRIWSPVVNGCLTCNDRIGLRNQLRDIAGNVDFQSKSDNVTTD